MNNLIKLLLSLILTLQITGVSYAESKKESFTFEGRQATLIIPEKPLPGNPWVWRAHFPEWHTTVDSILIEKGYHIAYINTNDMYGSPRAMQVWDRFYNYLVSQRNLAPTVALEGVSRGGLYVHNWAKRNPTKVSCIYAEAPACDFKVWSRVEHAAGWEQLNKEYGFVSDDQALKYKDTPIHNIAGLAAIGVPILHSISNSDNIVPPSYNSLLFADKYIKSGGTITIMPMKRVFNVSEMKGHHFHIDNADDIAAFIHQNSYPVRNMLNSSNYHHLNGTTALNCNEVFEKTKKGNIVFFGGSITYNNGWRDNMAHYFMSRFPDASLNFVNAGIPSLGSVPHSFRFATDILQKQIPDVLFLEAAVNDRSNAYSDEAQVKAMEGIIRRAKEANPKMDIIIMHFADPDKISDYDKGVTPKEILNHNSVAEYYNIPVIDISREVYDRIKNGEFSWNDDIKDLHPSAYGQEIYSNSMKTLLDTLMYKSNGTPNVAKETKPINKLCYDKARYEKVDRVKGTFKYYDKYIPSNGQETREGFTNVPMLVGEKPLNELTYQFNGNTIGLCVISGNDAGIIEYSIDGSKYKTLDLYTQWSGSLHLPWYVILETGLKEKNHTLNLRISPDKNEKSKGNACRIVHFLVN